LISKSTSGPGKSNWGRLYAFLFVFFALFCGNSFSTGLISNGPAGAAKGETVHHYVFFNRDRERISEASFLDTAAFEGAQLKYTWRELERQKDAYDFDAIEHDLAFLTSKGKKLFIQIQDASFDTNFAVLPRYILNNPEYHGGAALQYNIDEKDEARSTPEGWVARRWDPAVQERFHKLLFALGGQFDGKIEGINLPETAVDFGETGRLYPQNFRPDDYCAAIITNMIALKRAFPHSVTIQYANFMPGIGPTVEGREFLNLVYQRARELSVGVGAPDLLPYKPGQMSNCYSLIRAFPTNLPSGIAVQDGNYEYQNPKTGKQVSISELVEFATNYLRVDYLFWCTQEPFYSKDLIPFLRAQK
jgi:hypothetical protein